ncbi:MAG TPA: c(7)-type cytochrome triheme domain-containing protein [Azospirillum sp.]|nr:c(7)-type cytochrome triheme domain-containing protein [Azospirillum sp.]
MRRHLTIVAVLGAALLWGVASAPAGDAGGAHPPLGTEGLYDPTNPSLSVLQQPAEALAPLPPALAGNHVNWVEALNRGLINPRKGVTPDAGMNAVDMNVLMTRTASMPNVKFPHREHTQWLACTNCHPAIFLPKKGGNPTNMHAILKGEFCGVCHGKVAFPLTDCFRCHNTPQDPRRLR